MHLLTCPVCGESIEVPDQARNGPRPLIICSTCEEPFVNDEEFAAQAETVLPRSQRRRL